MKYSLHHVHIKSTDPASVADWFVRAFGFEVLSDVKHGGGRLIQCAIGSAQPPFITITEPSSGQTLPEARSSEALGLEHFALTTTNINESLKQAQKFGAELLGGPTMFPDGTLQAFIGIPAGVRIELVQFAEMVKANSAAPIS